MTKKIPTPNTGAKDTTQASVPVGHLATLCLSPKATVMRDLAKDLPIHKDFGLPEYIYRADLLPETLEDLDPVIRDQHLEAALIELDFDQGYPILPNAEPFWSRLQHESPEAFRAFTHYLDMPRPARGQATPVRQIHALCKELSLSIETLMSYAYTYYWAYRAAAYDSFTLASHAKMKEHRLLAIEAEHFEMSSKFVDQVKAKLEDMLADDEADISAKELLDILKFFAQLQRLSLGVAPFSAGIPKDAQAFPLNSSLEVIMRTLNLNSGSGTNSKPQNTQDFTKQLFDNPKELEQAQELIIKMGNIQHPRTQRQLTFQDDTDADKTGA